MTDPVIPAVYAILWYAIPLLHAALLVAAVLTIVKAPFLSPIERVTWTIVSIVIPILGPLAWLAFYFTDARRRRQRPSPGRA